MHGKKAMGERDSTPQRPDAARWHSFREVVVFPRSVCDGEMFCETAESLGTDTEFGCHLPQSELPALDFHIPEPLPVDTPDLGKTCRS